MGKITIRTMAKDTFYFQHDYAPTSDPKIQALLGEYGGVGYGIFWRIVEMLHSAESHMIPKKPYIYSALAKQMLTDVEQLETIIEYMITTCELFCQDKDFIWSDRVMRNIEKRDNLKEGRSKAGKASAEARKKATLVEQTLTPVEQNPTKESKEKESKVNKKEKDTAPNGGGNELGYIEKTTQFYKSEIQKNASAPLLERYRDFVNFIFLTNPTEKPIDCILKVRDQVCFADFTKLWMLSGNNMRAIYDKVEVIINRPDYVKKNTSVYLTLKNYLKRDSKQ